MRGEVTSRIAYLAGLIKPELPITAGMCVLAGEVIARGHLPSLLEGVFGSLVGSIISDATMASHDHFDQKVVMIDTPSVLCHRVGCRARGHPSDHGAHHREIGGGNARSIALANSRRDVDRGIFYHWR